MISKISHYHNYRKLARFSKYIFINNYYLVQDEKYKHLAWLKVYRFMGSPTIFCCCRYLNCDFSWTENSIDFFYALLYRYSMLVLLYLLMKNCFLNWAMVVRFSRSLNCIVFLNFLIRIPFARSIYCKFWILLVLDWTSIL